MAACISITKTALLKNVLISRLSVVSGVKHYWTRDWKPGPYPRTQEERAAAAKKYGLLPEDYEPYPDDGLGLGDYPKLPAISGDARDDFEAWDYPVHKRNFGEPIHADVDAHGQDRINLQAKPYPPRRTQFFVLVTVLSAWFYFSILGEKYKAYHPTMPKQLYNDNGVVHYTFEPDDSPKPEPVKKRGYFK